MNLSNSDRIEYQSIMNQVLVGYLGLKDSGNSSRVIPVNFALDTQTILIHGAQEGEKYNHFSNGSGVAMSVVREYSVIPSHWMGGEYACAATMYYKSVYLRGTTNVITDIDGKTAALNVIMQKYQPGGNFRTIDINDPHYTTALKNVGILTIVPTDVQVKIKLGQFLETYQRRRIIERLEDRGTDIDRLTASEMKKMLEEKGSDKF
ncbi:pyridoxamine 5'-phosphate oxidase family protein [candidate division KSB1 bacterium]|nr:pyridoxamine 5'-phosphate oxidase family protein [candidate division KSB1 bacterium]